VTPLPRHPALFVLSCLWLAACAPSRHMAQPQPGLSGSSSQPVRLPPRVFEPEVPKTDEQWRALGREAAALLSQYVAINTTNPPGNELETDRKSTRLNSSHGSISYAVFCLIK